MKLKQPKNLWFLYFLKNSSWVYKIWITKNLGTRLRLYNLWNHIDINILFIAKIFDYSQAEREVKKYFSSHCKDVFKREWAILTPEQEKEVIKIAQTFIWAICFNSHFYWQDKVSDNSTLVDFYHTINITKAVNVANKFFKTIDFI